MCRLGYRAVKLDYENSKNYDLMVEYNDSGGYRHSFMDLVCV